MFTTRRWAVLRAILLSRKIGFKMQSVNGVSGYVTREMSGYRDEGLEEN